MNNNQLLEWMILMNKIVAFTSTRLDTYAKGLTTKQQLYWGTFGINREADVAEGI